MASCNSKTRIKIPPDIDETYTLTPSSSTTSSSMSMQMSARTAKAIYQDDQQFDLYNASSKSLSIIITKFNKIVRAKS